MLMQSYAYAILICCIVLTVYTMNIRIEAQDSPTAI